MKKSKRRTRTKETMMKRSTKMMKRQNWRDTLEMLMVMQDVEQLL